MIYLFLISLWGIYFLLHSFLAGNKLVFLGRSSRMVYNIIATLGLFGIFTFIALQPSFHFWTKSGIGQVLGLILATYGILVMKKAFKHYSLAQFLGVSPQATSPQLITTGILQYVRHPIYTATILLTSGFFIFAPTDLHLISSNLYICLFSNWY